MYFSVEKFNHYCISIFDFAILIVVENVSALSFNVNGMASRSLSLCSYIFSVNLIAWIVCCLHLKIINRLCARGVICVAFLITIDEQLQFNRGCYFSNAVYDF